MPYRRTERVLRRLAARHDEIVAAARRLAAEQGMAAVQIALVADRAGIAAGTVYRYFPAKLDLIRALIDRVREQETAALSRAARCAPGPLSALAAAIARFALHAAAEPRLAWAVLAEPVDGDISVLQFGCRGAIAAEFEELVARAIEARHLPEQDAKLAAAALVGAIVEGLVAPSQLAASTARQGRDAAQTMALFALRALGAPDARARGLVVQTAWPVRNDAA